MNSTQKPWKKALVLGLGVSGRSAAHFLAHKGIAVVAVDKDPLLIANLAKKEEFKEQGVLFAEESTVFSLDSFSHLILSPGIPSSHPLVERAKLAGLKVMGEIELGCQFADADLIAVTGTNGKTTVTLLVEHVLNQSGKKTQAVGNVGTAFTQELIRPTSSLFVLELSSYQIETLETPSFESAIILNITPDHLDRYGHMEAYARAKLRLALNLKVGKNIYVSEQVWQNFSHLWEGPLPLVYGYLKDAYLFSDGVFLYVEGQKIFTLPAALQNKKSHELENFMAAFALTREKGVTPEQFLQAYQSFKKPAHRIEFVAEKEGVRFFDDSKGTNIDAVIRAVESIEGSIILIAGGVDKGFTYTPWIDAFAGKVRQIFAIGQAAAKIQAELGMAIAVQIEPSLEEAVRQAALAAKAGESVLLSPGCSSFDMFKDYAHRGEVFQSAVKSLVHISV